MLTGSLVAIATPMQRGRRARSPGPAQAHRFPRRQRHGGHRHRRHHRRIADRRLRRALPADQDGVDHARRAACRSSPAPAPTRRARRSSSPRSPRSAGADARLSVVPYYNKPTQEGLYRHFRADRRGGRPAADPLQRARPHRRRPRHTRRRCGSRSVPSIVGIKDATADLDRGSRLLIGACANGQDRFRAAISGDDDHRAGADAAGRPRRDLGHGQRRAAR